MIWKRYRNELMVLLASVFLIIGYSYKNIQISKLYGVKSEVSKSIYEIDKIIALKKQWDGKRVKSKIKLLKKDISSDNIKYFNIKNRKMEAIFKDLTGRKMNKIFSKIESMAVEIVTIKVTSKDEKYKMEVKCKW